ncbi:MAG: alpha/beta hydrolase [Novosphingobium sp. 17-62-19]|uniref:esterase/lipase family protein n=1 Tax=Novosphingobium sp. 17-62-19 TaxID=1970406 RepID=UPI000BC9E406|nr:alpha/beta fold hydrolase [Novosphingobium sp. 17-62-19]OZA19343.1 MAG: alpha/beta hydrolase [Novosphingobium sp. 17-62-19]HQS96943.1 alpha/beta fold hydrolase [Novosphingobium sp.]
MTMIAQHTVNEGGFAQFSARIALVRAEMARRGALAFQPRPAGVRGPKWQALLGELRTPVEHWQATRQPRIVSEPSAPSRAVMLLPGFGTHPARMKPLGRALEAAGHRVSDWGLGFNFGPTEDRFERLCERVVAMARKEGEPLVLIGWSLGGIFAREVARKHPEAVRLVITMGTPFSGDRRANNAWRAYQLIAGHSVDTPPIGMEMSVKPPVPTVALWSARDGIVSPRSSCGRKGERDLAVPMRCTHLGFAAHPDVAAMLKRLVAAY